MRLQLKLPVPWMPPIIILRASAFMQLPLIPHKSQVLKGLILRPCWKTPLTDNPGPTPCGENVKSLFSAAHPTIFDWHPVHGQGSPSSLAVSFFSYWAFLVRRSGTHTGSRWSWGKTQTDPRAQVSMGSGPRQMPVKMSFYFTMPLQAPLGS